MLILLLMKSRFRLILLPLYLNPDLLSNRLQHECLRTTKSISIIRLLFRSYQMMIHQSFPA